MARRLHIAKRMLWTILSVSGIALLAQNCAKMDFAEMPPEPLQLQSIEQIPESRALVYGASSDERRLLAEKIAGYKAPSLADIFNNWRRISGGTVYANLSAIDIKKAPNAYCFTEILPTGLWKNTLNPAGVNISPSMADDCANQVWFASVSWALIDGGKLHNATNSGNFNGFISGLKFDHFTHQAILSSASTDDDDISLIIATAQDSQGIWHTLSASRDQGGVFRGNGNWRIVHRKENKVIKTFGERHIGSINSNVANGLAGDGKGWNSRASLVRVERKNNIIHAQTSDWGTDADKTADLPLVPSSLIEIDLNDNSLGLEIFRGAAFVGYGIHSQALSRFSDLKFHVLHDERYVFDLRDNKVYEQNTDGTYGLRSELDAFDFLGFPSKVSNVETQLQYLLEANKRYTRSE